METSMHTTDIIEHSGKIAEIREKVIRQQILIKQIHASEREKNWLFYDSEEKAEWYENFFKKLKEAEETLERLKNDYTKTLKLLIDDSNSDRTQQQSH